MPTLSKLSITPLAPAGFDEFLAYIVDHLSDNGQGGTALFQPRARDETPFPADSASAFRVGLLIPLSERGWRRAWLIRSEAGQIIGHVDLRSHPERLAAHRCLLGMGVQRDHRRQGLGARLLDHAEQWALAQGAIDWVDLKVMSVNTPAIALYLRAGYAVLGETPDMFRIDGESVAFTAMAKKLAR